MSTDDKYIPNIVLYIVSDRKISVSGLCISNLNFWSNEILCSTRKSVTLSTRTISNKNIFVHCVFYMLFFVLIYWNQNQLY